MVTKKITGEQYFFKRKKEKYFMPFASLSVKGKLF